MKYSGRERRRHERKPISMQVKYHSLDAFFYDYALNVSHGGMFIKTRRPLARGSRVEIEFEIPGLDKPFKTTGQVARVIFPGEDEQEPAGMGIEFDALSDEDRDLIDSLWQANARNKGGE